MIQAKIYRPFTTFDSEINCDVDIPSKLGAEYEPIRIDSAIRSHECKSGMIKGELHKTKFTEEQIEFIDRCGIDKPQSKFAYELITGNITQAQFTTACNLLYDLAVWRNTR